MESIERYYRQWDYPYKPSLESFGRVVRDCERDGMVLEDYVRSEIEHYRTEAYYSRCQSTAHSAFQRLMSLLYIAMVNDVRTPYNHVLKSDKNFEYKLNNLHRKE